MSTKRVCDMGIGALHEFAIALDKAGFTADVVQSVTNSSGNRKARIMRAAIAEGAWPEDRFEKIDDFPIVLPQGYVHETYLDQFLSRHGEEFHGRRFDLNREVARKAMPDLTPGQCLRVRIYKIKSGEMLTDAECVAFLKSKKAIRLGAQGLCLVYKQRKQVLLKPNCTVVSFSSFSREEDGTSHMTSWVRGIEFRDVRNEVYWDSSSAILCFSSPI